MASECTVQGGYLTESPLLQISRQHGRQRPYQHNRLNGLVFRRGMVGHLGQSPPGSLVYGAISRRHAKWLQGPTPKGSL